MEGTRHREIIVKIQRISTVEKRALTSYRFCHACRDYSDFLSPTTAAELFEVAAATIAGYLAESDGHASPDGELCLTSLLRRRTLSGGKS